MKKLFNKFLILQKEDMKGMKKKNNAVSPVIGVLLMLVVTIIIAAVVSGFAGGLVGGQDSAPSLTMDVTIKNSGEYSNSYANFIVNSVSEPIPTKDIKIITEWTHNSTVSGGNVTAAGLNYPNVYFFSGNSNYQSPVGYGPGLNGDTTVYGGMYANQQFGNYTLVAGTAMNAQAAGNTKGGYGLITPYEYTIGGSVWKSGSYDCMMALLGNNWNSLRKGDIVSVKILHIPSGKFIFSKDMIIEK